MEPYIDYWRQYGNFSGKTTVSGYWFTVLFKVIIEIILFFVFILLLGAFGTITGLNSADFETIFKTVIELYVAINIVPSLAITVRRLRDAGYSCKAFLWLLVPMIGTIALLARLCAKSAKPVEDDQ